MAYNPRMTGSDTTARWLQTLSSGSSHRLRYAMPATVAYIALFMLGYFALLRHPVFPVTVIPPIGLDRLIGFAPWSLALYVSLWFYVSLVPTLIGWREAPYYVAAATTLGVAGFAIFFLWPTAVPPPEVDWSAHPAVAFLKSVDATGNACPSLHAAFAVLTFLWLRSMLAWARAPLGAHLVNGLWCLGILYSTLATKQHMALDLFAGVALGAAVALPFLRLSNAAGSRAA